MSRTINHSGTPSRSRIRLGASALALAAFAGTGIAASSLTHHDEPAPEAMSAIPVPCDDFMDCVYTASWYYFYR